MTGRPIIVAGGGIAGLAAALAFAARGTRVRIFERAPALEEVGAGLQLSPNATRILQDLQVLEPLIPLAVSPRAVVLRHLRTLEEIARVPLGEAAVQRWSAPYLTIHRADLQRILLRRVTAEPSIDLIPGAEVTALRLGHDGITVMADGKEEVGAFLVGADGVHSAVRRLSGGAACRATGTIAWRATIASDSEAGQRLQRIAGRQLVTAFLHPGAHLIAYPIRAGEAFNLVAFTRRCTETAPDPAQTRNLFSALDGAADEVIHLLEEAAPWSIWPLHVLPAGGRWTRSEGLALIGDAAHAMTPFAAQGAAMAIEDAETLAAAVCAAREDRRSEALAAWERMRQARVARVRRRGAFNALVWHAAGPMAFARDRVLKLRPAERLVADLDWLYGWRPPGANPG